MSSALLNINTPLCKRCGSTRRAEGFTILEIAVVLIISAIIMTAGLRLLSVRAERSQIDVTRLHQEAIKSALIAYLGKTNRLPCPDTNQSGHETFTGNTCSAYLGTVPYADLGLEQAVVLDGWENYIKYVVSPPQPTVPAPPAVTPPAPPWTTSWMYSYTPVTPLQDSTRQTNGPLSLVNPGPPAFWPTTSTGAIVVNNVAGIAIGTPLAIPPTGAVVVLISHGKNGFGAINVKGAQNVLPLGGTDELVNVNVSPPASVIVYDRDISDVDAPGRGGSGAFDDLVMVIRREDLISPLTTNGTLQASANQALSQANDIVTGIITSSPNRSCSYPATPPQCACTYTVPGTSSVPPSSFVGLSATWGVQYISPGTSTITCQSVGSTNEAYHLQSGDGTVRTVSINEIYGVILRAAGFN